MNENVWKFENLRITWHALCNPKPWLYLLLFLIIGDRIITCCRVSHPAGEAIWIGKPRKVRVHQLPPLILFILQYALLFQGRLYTKTIGKQKRSSWFAGNDYGDRARINCIAYGIHSLLLFMTTDKDDDNCLGISGSDSSLCPIDKQRVKREMVALMGPFQSTVILVIFHWSGHGYSFCFHLMGWCLVNSRCMRNELSDQ